MKPRFEIERFPDKRLKLTVRFFPTSNFWINEKGEATWVPTLEETNQLYETLGMTNFYNLNKPKIPQLKQQCVGEQV
jgi:hypothetical protein